MVTPDRPTNRAPLTDSPWYWLYLFATAALVALVLMGPRYAARQAQLERNLQGRQRAAQQAAGDQPTTPLTAEDQPTIRLSPLYAIMAVLLLAAWTGLLVRHYRLRRLPEPHEPARPPAADAPRDPQELDEAYGTPAR